MEFILIIFLIICSLYVAVDGGICLLIDVLFISGNVNNLSGWFVSALIIGDTWDQVIDDGMLLVLVFCLFA